MGRKWANIVKKKGVADKKRGQVYTKILFEITKAVKASGEDPHSNFLLKIALDKAKQNNVPRDNIDKAIKKGSGGADDGYHEISYEGYGVKGVAIFVEASTNNVTRTIANVRACFNRAGGSLGTPGSLQFVFSHKAVFEVPQGNLNEDDFTLALIDAGAEDITLEDGYFCITGAKENFGILTKKLQELGVTPEEAGLQQVPVNFKEVDNETYRANMDLIEALEEDEDVIKVYHNIEYRDEFANL